MRPTTKKGLTTFIVNPSKIRSAQKIVLSDGLWQIFNHRWSLRWLRGASAFPKNGDEVCRESKTAHSGGNGIIGITDTLMQRCHFCAHAYGKDARANVTQKAILGRA